jgi:hypothetical protein
VAALGLNAGFVAVWESEGAADDHGSAALDGAVLKSQKARTE